jgi:hypothetical protein
LIGEGGNNGGENGYKQGNDVQASGRWVIVSASAGFSRIVSIAAFASDFNRPFYTCSGNKDRLPGFLFSGTMATETIRGITILPLVRFSQRSPSLEGGRHANLQLMKNQ